jgi:hypothetical protein
MDNILALIFMWGSCGVTLYLLISLIIVYSAPLIGIIVFAGLNLGLIILAVNTTKHLIEEIKNV